MSKSVLVTGAAGFIGFHTCRSLLEEGFTVVGIDNINDYYNPQLKYDRLEALGIAQTCAQENLKYCKSRIFDKFIFSKIDVADSTALDNLVAELNVGIIIHLAAQAGVRYSLQNPSAYIESNIEGFKNILEICRHHSIEHLVYASSSSVYGDNAKIPFNESDNVDHPVSLYAATKKSNELMAHTYSHLFKIPTTGLRFFTVYGPWGRPDMAPMLFANALLNDAEIQVFNHGDMSRDFTYIDDIVEGIKIAMHNPKESDNLYQIFNIGNGSPVQLMDFISLLENGLGKTAKKKFMEMQPGDVPRTWADTSKLEKLGYKSHTSIEDGTSKFANWFLNYTSKSTI